MISFSCQNVKMPGLDLDRVRQWIARVAEKHGFMVRRLSYLFCDDETILEQNIKFLGHDYYTDIITFDYTSKSRIAGDMIISLDTVRTNSEIAGEGYDRELLRVIIHGVLHLCGINDKGPGEREVMEQHENEALTLYNQL